MKANLESGRRAAQKQSENTARNVFLAILAVLIPPIGIPLSILIAILSRTKKKAEEPAATRGEPRAAERFRSAPEGRPAHGHTPVQYSYDTCATAKRLEQLDVLYKAGLYTKEQYLEAKAKIAKA